MKSAKEIPTEIYRKEYMKDVEEMDNSVIREEILKRLGQRNETLELLIKQKTQILEQFKDLKDALLEEVKGIEREIISLEKIMPGIPPERGEVYGRKGKEKVDTSRIYQSILSRIKELPFIKDVQQIRPGRSSYLINQNKRLILRYSKRLQHQGKPLFFYGLPFQFLAPNNLILFICASPDNVSLVPTNEILPYKDTLKYREKGKYYYFHIYNEEGSYVLRISKIKKLDLTKYLNLYEILH